MSEEKNNLDGSLSILSIDGVRAVYPHGAPGTRLESPEQVYEALKIFLDLGLAPTYLRVDQAGIGVRNDDGQGGGMPPEGLIRLALQLNELRWRKGFSDLSVGLKNPTQFLSTIFEVDCMSYMASLPGVGDVEISPEVQVAGKTKRPDFKLTGANFELYCECKSMASVNRGVRSKALRLSRLVTADVEKIIPDGLRLEIAIQKLPRDWNNGLRERILGVAIATVQQNAVSIPLHLKYGKSEFWAKLCRSGDPPHYTGCLVASAAPEGQGKFVVYEWLDLREATKSLMRDALTQVPLESDALVHIFGWTGRELEDAAREFFAVNKHPHLVGLLAWTDRPRFAANPRAVHASPGVAQLVEAIVERQASHDRNRPF
jgi:hypothetical protein